MLAVRQLALVAALALGVGAAMLPACRVDDPNHCINRGGDSDCEQKFGVGPGEAYCTNNCGGATRSDGCLLADTPPSEEGCWNCEGQGSQGCGDGDGDSSESGTDGDGDTTVDDDSTTGPQCEGSDECPDETPICEGGECVGCGDAMELTCGSEYPETPVCGAAGCVECSDVDVGVCGGDTPVCEGEVCVGCEEHDQCPASACNMMSGACMDPERVWWVDADAGAGGDGSEAMPFDSFADVWGMIGAGEEGVVWLGTAGVHAEQFQVPGGRTVALLGKGSGWLSVVGVAAITVNGTLFLGELRVEESAVGLDCDIGGAVWLDEVELRENDTRGLNTDGCDATIRQSRIVQNVGSGVRIVAGSVTIETSFIGGDVSDQFAIDLVGGTISILYSTVIAGFGTAEAIHCTGDGTGSTVRDSLLASRGDMPELGGCIELGVSASALETDIVGNVVIGTPQPNWFVDLASGDFHLTVNAPVEIATAATWQTGDPATDIDGDLRPTLQRTPDFAGADIPD